MHIYIYIYTHVYVCNAYIKYQETILDLPVDHMVHHCIEYFEN